MRVLGIARAREDGEDTSRVIVGATFRADYTDGLTADLYVRADGLTDA